MVKHFSVKWITISYPTFFLLPAILAFSLLPQVVNANATTLLSIKKILLSIIFILGGITLNKIINLIINYNYRKLDIHKKDNLHERKVQTKIRYLKIVINIAILIISLALALRQFDSMRQLSTSILASAGIIGIVVAFSAQKLFGNILAGFEVAFSQPIRIDDVVVLEGEWGRIEEINATNVVVKIWDERRLVLPITYFVEKPFQNWTKKNSDILGTVELFVDYTMPIAPLRKELTKILKATDLWDGKVNVLQVTETSEKSMKVRALMSAKDSGIAWDLRCLVREKMIDFMQKNYPEQLPKLRAEMKREKN